MYRKSNKEGSEGMSLGKIIKVSGPLVVADGMSDANMQDTVRVGDQRLIGEILDRKSVV